jgi:hypothetical protein
MLRQSLDQLVACGFLKSAGLSDGIVLVQCRPVKGKEVKEEEGNKTERASMPVIPQNDPAAESGAAYRMTSAKARGMVSL